MIRFHRSIKLFPGLRLYVGKRGPHQAQPRGQAHLQDEPPLPIYRKIIRRLPRIRGGSH
jgi:hypothetical protein